jgi:hypothetical protein
MKTDHSETGEVTIIVLNRRRTTSVIRRVAWINFKFSLMVWGIAMLFYPPLKVQEALQGNAYGWIHYAWTGMCIVGAFISIVGISMSFTHDVNKLRRRAIPIELAGLCLMIMGPVIYFTTQLSLLLGGLPESFRDRLALTIFALAMVNAVIARLCQVIPRFHKE